MNVEALLWPKERVAEAIARTARASGLRLDDAPKPGDPGGGALVTPSSARTNEAVFRWAASSAETLGLEAELVSCSYREIDGLLAALGPALVPIQRGGEGELGFLALLPRRGARAALLGPDGRVHRVSLGDLRTAVAITLESRLRSRGVAGLIEAAGVAPKRRDRVLRAIAVEQYGSSPMGPFLMLRPHPGASVASLARHAGLMKTTLALVLSHLARTAAVMASFWLVGEGALNGSLELGWLLAWVLALVSTIPLGAIAGFAQGRFAIALGRLIKQRLLYGALRLPQDEVRHEGAGSLLGRVLESTAVEGMFLAGALGSVLAIVELALAAWVLGEGAGGALSLGLFAGYAAIIAVAVQRLYVKNRRWTDQRLAMTHDLVERMVGHRTRLAQEPVEEWHADEDRVLDAYLDRSRELDGGSFWVSLLPRGWVVLGAIGLAPAFVAGAGGTSLAIGIGGVLLGLSALGSLAGGLLTLASAAIAWRRVEAIFRAASAPSSSGDLETMLAEGRGGSTRPVIEARELTFRYPGRERAVLRGCSLSISPGEHVLLVGPSGGGKSTLAAVIGGLRDPGTGVLLLEGLDPRSLGHAAWRQRVATVPQFHENHVLSASFAFNALMGAEWPPSRAELDALEAVCDELGLGPLLDRMPARLEQTVGDNGWQLSHGERSRLFIARALLAKDARLLVFDESFAALDPMTLERCVRAVRKRARTLLVIAHP